MVFFTVPVKIWPLTFFEPVKHIGFEPKNRQGCYRSAAKKEIQNWLKPDLVNHNATC